MKKYKLAISDEQLTISNEQLAISEVSKRSGLPKRSTRKQRHCSLLIAHCSLFITHCSLLIASLLIVSCDLFTGPKVDLFQQIKGEIDWDNAPKLTVRIDYPSAWGISNPIRGDITPTTDLRKGYEFSVTFTPGSAYALKSWQVYYTSDLDKVSGQPEQRGNWLDDPSFIEEEGIEPITDSSEVKLPTVDADDDARGGTFKFTIYTTEPVTLVPWCDPQLRITKTTPYNRLDPPVSRATAIVIYFNGAIDDKTVKFAETKTADGIWIESVQDGDPDATLTNNEYGWYNDPECVASNGLFMIIITPKTMSPENSKMTVKLNGITDMYGNAMIGSGLFSWKTISSSSNVHVDSWSAVYEYDEVKKSGNIKVNYAQTGADRVETNYRLNKGQNIPFEETIISVPGPDDSGIREGRQISGIREYEIFIELYEGDAVADFVSFKIWNFPDMVVSNDNPVYEVINAASALNSDNRTVGLANLVLNDATKQYVLANDINIISTWAPIGSDAVPFKGKFYGNGRTITLNNGFSGDGDLGLFGYAQDATIRDLTLAYNNQDENQDEINVAASLSTPFEMYETNINNDYDNDGQPDPESSFPFDFTALRVGGLAGHLKNSEVCNIITSGGTIKVKSKPCGGIITLPFGEDGADTDFPDGGVLLGGIAGYVEGGTVLNCRAALSTQFTPGSSATFFAVTGAIAGIAVKGSIDEVTIAANVNADIIDFIGTVGGAVGISQRNTLTDITFSAGAVSFFGNPMLSVCAGIVGMSSMVTMERCSFLGNITVNTNADVTIGGLVGNNETNSGRISNCLVQGNINLTGNGSPTVGGFLGVSKNRNNFTIENCFFNGGNITVTGTNNKRPDIGGFCGSLGGIPNPNIINCGVLSGTLTANVTGILRVGGFISYIDGSISDSFSRMDIVVNSNSTSACRVGGFSGMLASSTSTIDRCFATGTVSVVTVSTNSPLDGSNTPGQPSAGGLVGSCQGTITNSYALGNVVLSDSGNYGPAAAGGIVGRIDGGSISNCFSAGRVSSLSALATSGKEALSGGIAGFSNGQTIQKTAALGANVTARGDTKAAGRILGTSNIGSSNYNYALNTMVIEEGAYNSLNPFIRNADSGVTTRDGQDAASSAFLKQSFWTGTLGFDNAIWNFSRVARDGYPRLAWEK
ncbi:GLUG motif-containing protein [Treponema sp. R80B11-R83G3]